MGSPTAAVLWSTGVTFGQDPSPSAQRRRWHRLSNRLHSSRRASVNVAPSGDGGQMPVVMKKMPKTGKPRALRALSQVDQRRTRCFCTISYRSSCPTSRVISARI